MRLLILLAIVLNYGNSFAQKHKRSNKKSFTYSYRLDAADFNKSATYTVKTMEWNADSVIISCSADANIKLSGTISYEYNLIFGTAFSSDGRFQFKLPKAELETTNLRLTLVFDGYEQTIIDADFDGIPDEFSVELKANTIFDEETPYVFIHSVYPLTVDRQIEIINCLSNGKSEVQNCYDENLIKVVIPI